MATWTETAESRFNPDDPRQGLLGEAAVLGNPWMEEWLQSREAENLLKRNFPDAVPEQPEILKGATGLFDSLGRGRKKVFEEGPQGSDTDVDFYNDPFADYAEQSRIAASEALGLDPHAIGTERISNDFKLMMAGTREGATKTLLSDFKLMPASIAGPLTILQGIFSEGHGQIGRTGIDSDAYWNPGGPEHGPSIESQVYGYASATPGSMWGQAVNRDGTFLNTKDGAYMLGIVTDKGQDAFNSGLKGKSPTNEDAAVRGSIEYTGQHEGLFGTRDIPDVPMGGWDHVNIDPDEGFVGGDQGTNDEYGPGGDQMSGTYGPGSGFGYDQEY
jgi:hypothetical protein